MLDKISVLTVAVTYRCNSKCRHCQIPSPQNSDCVKPALFQKLLLNLKQKGLKHVCLWGGEPLLEPLICLELLSICKNNGIKSSLISNGFWGKDKKQAEKIAKKLADEGLDEIHISADPFHQEWIPLESVICALSSSVEMGIPKVFWVGKELGDVERDNRYNQQLTNIVKRLQGISGGQKSYFSGKIQAVGRAAMSSEISSHIPYEDKAAKKCPAIHPVNRLGIDPEGNITCCDGIALATVSDYLDNGFDVKGNLIFRVLWESGPEGLAKLAGMDTKERLFAGPCNLCWEARNQLKQDYDEILRPSCFYV